MPGIIAFVVSSITSSAAMCYMSDLDKRRHQYHLHSLQIWSRIALAFVSFGIKQESNAFDIALTVCLVVGAEIISLLGSVRGLKLAGYHPALIFIKHALSFFAIIIAAVLTLPFVNKNAVERKLESVAAGLNINLTGLGSQPECPLPSGWLTIEPWILCCLLITVWAVVIWTYCVSGISKRKFWYGLMMFSNVIWIAALAGFIGFAPKNVKFINKSSWNITVGQLFSIFLSVATIVPTLKHAFDKMIQAFGIADNVAPGSEISQMKDKLEQQNMSFA